MEYKYNDIAKFLKENGIKYEIGNGKTKKTMYEMPPQAPLYFRVIKLSDDGTKAEAFLFWISTTYDMWKNRSALCATIRQSNTAKTTSEAFIRWTIFLPTIKYANHATTGFVSARPRCSAFRTRKTSTDGCRNTMPSISIPQGYKSANTSERSNKKYHGCKRMRKNTRRHSVRWHNHTQMSIAYITNLKNIGKHGK